MNQLTLLIPLAGLAWVAWRLRALWLPWVERWLPAARAAHLPAAVTNPAGDVVDDVWRIYRRHHGDTPASRTRYERDVFAALLTLVVTSPGLHAPSAQEDHA